jgi:sec-independent protein translocase protein TatB
VLNFSPEKLFLVGVIALMVLGPNRLPQAARSLGRLVATMRRMSQGFREEVRTAMAEPTEIVNSAVADFRPPDVRGTVREAINSTFTTVNSQTGAGNQAGTTTNLPTGTPDDPTLN